MVQFTKNGISSIYYGDKQVKEIYYGSSKVYSSTGYIPSTTIPGDQNLNGIRLTYNVSGARGVYYRGELLDSSGEAVTGITIDHGDGRTGTSLPSVHSYSSNGTYTAVINGRVYNINGKYSNNNFNAAFISNAVNQSIPEIGSNAYVCPYLTGLYIGDDVGLVSIGSAFGFSRNLTSIRLPSTLKSIGGWFSYAFTGCTSLTKLDLRNCTSLLNIDTFAFGACTSLTKVILPPNLKQMHCAFGGCTSLNTVVCMSKTPPVVKTKNCFYNVPDDMVVKVPRDSVELYKQTTLWQDFTIEEYKESDFT